MVLLRSETAMQASINPLILSIFLSSTPHFWTLGSGYIENIDCRGKPTAGERPESARTVFYNTIGRLDSTRARTPLASKEGERKHVVSLQHCSTLSTYFTKKPVEKRKGMSGRTCRAARKQALFSRFDHMPC